MSERTPPLIGLTTYCERATHGIWTEDAVLAPRTYADFVSRAGGAPVLLPPQLSNGAGALEPVLDRLDGLLLIGGEDVCGLAYGRDEAPGEHEIEGHNPDRDRLEIEATRYAWSTATPILAICRGLQVMNVALGGTLIHDLPAAGASAEHRPQRGVFHHHRVDFAPDTLAFDLLGEDTQVPSHHHQAIERLADELRVSGRSQDGIIEAAETMEQGRFALGVQWHPEEGEDATLFEAFIEACEVSR